MYYTDECKCAYTLTDSIEYFNCYVVREHGKASTDEERELYVKMHRAIIEYCNAFEDKPDYYKQKI